MVIKDLSILNNMKIVKVENKENNIQPAIFAIDEKTNHIFMITIGISHKFIITDEGPVGVSYDENGNWIDNIIENSKSLVVI